jgi:FtsH-binding integral membrane protein
MSRARVLLLLVLVIGAALLGCARGEAAGGGVGGSRLLPSPLLRPQVAPSKLSQQAAQKQQQDTSSSSTVPADFLVRDSRVGFLRKVYGLLSVQLLLTALAGWGAMSHRGPILRAMAKNPKGSFGAVILSSLCGEIFSLIGLSNVNLRRKFPWNMALLAILTCANALLVATYAVMMPAKIILLALFQSSAAMLGLTLFAFQTNPKYDLTGFGAAVGSIFTVLFTFGLVMLFGRRTPMMHALYSAFGAGAVSLAIVYDTQLIIGGKHRIADQLSGKDYALGSAILYVDLIHLFLRLVEVMAYVLGEQD